MNMGMMTITWIILTFLAAPADTLDPPQDPPEEVEQAEEDPEADEEDVEEVEPYSITPETGFNEVLNDSLLRWEMLQNPTEWHFRQPGRITYRLGLIGRNDAALVEGHDPRHQRSFWGPVSVNDRVTGMMNPNRLPHYRFLSFKEHTRGIRYDNRFEMRRFYVTRPLTQVTLEQTGDEYRSVEGFLTQNISQKLNLEAGYWGKLEESGYPRNFMLGRKAWGSANYHLNDRYILRGMILYNGLQMDEPGGYLMDDMFTFPFQPFNATAIWNNARSSVRHTTYKASMYHRPDVDSQVNAQVTGYRHRNRRFFYSSTDSTLYRVHTNGIAARYHTRPVGDLEVDLEATGEYSGRVSDPGEGLIKRGWYDAEARIRWALPLLSRLRLDGWGEWAWRSDDQLAGQVGAGIELPLSRFIALDGAVSFGEVMPTPQQMYWYNENEDAVQGNPGLSNEEHRRAESGVILFPEFRFRMKGNAQVKQIREPILINEDNEFQQTGYYESWSGSGSMGYYGDHLTTELSLTSQFYFSDTPDPVLQTLNDSGFRSWTRFSAHYQNYVFDRAAYFKGGVISWFSPFAYQTGTYHPEMDYWDPHSFEQEIPPFVRLDVELSARVRNVIFRFRYENVLDEIVQPGYFEQALHPMNERRLRFGLQWILRN